MKFLQPGFLRSIILLCCVVFSCSDKKQTMTDNTSTDTAAVQTSTFSSDVDFLRKYTDMIVLEDSMGRAKIAVSGALQGRVMTSTSEGDAGMSYGWINKKAFSSGDTSEHMNAFGGEDRFWIGPEGGQYSLYFSKGVPFEFEHWHVPSIIDLDPFDFVSAGNNNAVFSKTAALTNYAGTVFNFGVKRTLRILEHNEALTRLGIPLESGVSSMVAFESVNELTNTGVQSWKKETGVLSIWILGMYNPSPTAIIVIPYRGVATGLESIVNDKYFGSVPHDRLKMIGNLIYFKADGKYRSKIGLPPQYAPEYLGSYDADLGVLTVVKYTRPTNAVDYVNSLWEIQKNPYKGDAVNAYNDGPPEPGVEPMGPFYELETSSPAAALDPGQTITHVHTTFHFHGTAEELDVVMKHLFGITHDIVQKVF
jgi:hypothetical protein